ncbi:putative metalloprotease CJM1_0395 family protein [Blastopirellula marina]|uniref:Catalase n=1 Tax=Blastopirellula marina TaxID=124 RepID=A0A2S8GIN9_9BACT|nr:putative metalloprotease CJM1_0395 family protein [Blastopirellula marina]PQO44313.1 hypothetical protein C5Y93_20340 [Blastopirellula marina]
MHVQPLLLSSLNVVGSTLRGGKTSAPSAAQPQQSSQPEDELILSPEAQAAATDEAAASSGLQELTPEEQEQVDQLKARDQEVRQHEQAHLGAAGGFAQGGPTFTYQQGPDGQRYAIGGEVQIDTSPVDGDPEATIQKARVIQAAAQAPAEPSAQDKAVAAAAAQLLQSAQQELRERQADPEAAEGLDGEQLLASIDVNSAAEESSTSTAASEAQQAGPSAVRNYFLKEAQEAYSAANPPSAGNLFLLA